MNQPNKSESKQLESTLKQLDRIQQSTQNLYVRLVINGRDKKYSNAAREAVALIEQAAEKIKMASSEPS